jgi:hypothetical protein
VNSQVTAPIVPALPTAEEAGEPRVPRMRPSLDGSFADAPAHDQLAAPDAMGPPVPPGQLTSTAGDLLPPTPPAAESAANDVPLGPVNGPPGPGTAVAAIDLLARTPRSRPDQSASGPVGALSLVDPRGTEVEPEALLAPLVPPALSGDDAACLKSLQVLGVEYTAIPAIKPGAACEVARPLEVTSFGSGVSVAPKATLNCRTTEAVALWVRDVLIPKAQTELGARPIAIAPGSTYDCRGRNRQAGAKLSEHATANAFDVMSIAFADRPPVEITTRNPALPEARFQAAIREGSCALFTTVLGPGSDASHHNHLHFDLAVRGGGYRLCSLGETRTAGRRPEAAKPGPSKPATAEAVKPQPRRQPRPIAGPKPGL